MEYSARLKLKQMGLTQQEIDGIELIIPLLNDHQKLTDHKDRDEKIVQLIRENRSLTSETCILRKTIKKIVDHIGLTDAEFEQYNQMVEDCIAQVPEEDNSND